MIRMSEEGGEYWRIRRDERRGLEALDRTSTDLAGFNNLGALSSRPAFVYFSPFSCVENTDLEKYNWNHPAHTLS